MKYYLLVTVILVSILSPVMAQEKENVFLQRSYWTAQPSIEQIKADIEKGNDVLVSNNNGFDATVYAILEKNPSSTVQFLVEQGNSVNKLTHDSRTYIFWAAYKGDLESMQYFKNKGAKLDHIDSHGNTIMQFAAATGQENTAVYDFCINAGADVAEKKKEGGANLLLLFVGRSGNRDVISYFVNKGLPLNSVDDSGNNAFNYAARSANRELLDYLLAEGVQPATPKSGENAIYWASRNSRNELAYFQWLQSLGVKANVTSASGRTPLHNMASSIKNKELLDFFLAEGVDINAKNEEGNTMIMSAAYRNDVEMISYFIEKGANIKDSNEKGGTALANALRYNSPEVVAYLIEKGADLELQDEDGNSLSYYLIKSYRKGRMAAFRQKLEMLKAKGIDLLAKQKDGSTLYHTAIGSSSLELLQELKSLGIDVNAVDREGHTVLHYAAMKSHNNEIMKYLVSIGANTKIRTEFDETAYDLASENELLTKNNIDITFLNEE